MNILLILFGILGAFTAMGNDIDPILVSRFPGVPFGSVERVAVDGNRAYVLIGGFFSIIDIADPASPKPLGAHYDVSGSVGAAAVNGAFAYLSESPIGAPAGGILRVLNLSNPAAPTPVARKAAAGRQVDFALAGGTLLVALGTGIEAWDISDPTNPVSKSALATSSGVNRLALAGAYCYTANQSAGVKVIDYSNPSNMRQVGAALAGVSIVDLQTIDGFGYATGTSGSIWLLDIHSGLSPSVLRTFGTTSGPLAVDGDWLLAAHTTTVDVWNISDRANPTLAASVAVPKNANALAASNGHVLIGTTAGLMVGHLEASGKFIQDSFLSTVGQPIKVERQGSQIYIADSILGLRIADFSNPLVPKMLGTFTPPGTPIDLAVAGNLGYVATDQGIFAADISNSNAPVPAGSLIKPSARSIAVANNIGYASFSGSDLQVLDLSNPQNLRAAGSVSGVQFSTAVKFDGKFGAAAQGGAGITALDFSNPLAPRPVGVTSFWADTLVVISNFVFAPKGGGGSGLFRFDLSTPANLQAIQMAAPIFQCIVADKTRLLAGGPAGAYLFDVLDPAHPRLAGLYPYPTAVTKVGIIGDYGLVSQGTRAFDVIDLKHAANPQSIGKLSEAGGLNGFAVSGNFVYAGSSTGMTVINIANPAAPQRIAAVNINNLPISDVAVSGPVAFVCSGEATLRLYDITNPNTPSPLPGFLTQGTAKGALVSGSRLYLAAGANGLLICDVSAPDQPKLLGRAAVSNALKARLFGNRAIVAGGSAGFFIIDVSNPSAPSILGSVNTPGFTVDVAVKNQVAYVGDQNSLRIYDISNPAAPVFLRQFTDPSALPGMALSVWAYGAEALGNYLYVTDPARGLHVYDLTDPASPRRVGGNAILDSQNLKVIGGKIFMTGSAPSLAVLSPFSPEFDFGGGSHFIDGKFSMSVRGTPGAVIRIQRSPLLSNWQDWRTITLPATPVDVVDDQTTGEERQFYRAISP